MTNSKPTPDQIAEYLRLAILRGQLKANEPIRQDKIAAELGISKVPLREALAHLETEGLVALHMNRGAFVTPLSAAEASELYVIRTALETITLEKAVPVLTATDLVQAENVLRLMDIETDPARWNELNWQFHLHLYQPAKLPQTLKILGPLHLRVARYLVLYLGSLGFQERSQQEHYAILHACQMRDSPQASHLLRQHLDNAAQMLAEALAASP